MKLKKYTFKTPLFGSIDCEELLSDTDGRIELSPEQMCRMYDTSDKLLRFLTENMEDLAQYVPEELEGVVLRAEFGDCAMMNSRMYLRTYIWVEEDLTESAIEMIQEWITGQMSDGWGEGLEQREWMDKRVDKPYVYFDEYSLEFEEDKETHRVSYYVHPWNSKEYEIELEDCEEVEEDTKFEVVATMALPFHSRQVIKFSSDFALKVFMKDFGRGTEFAEQIRDSHPAPKKSMYVVRDLDGNSGIEILPKWTIESGSFCSLYDMSEDEEVRGTQMPVSKAILEMLK